VSAARRKCVDHMIRNGVAGVEFITANTDGQALSRTQLRARSTGIDGPRAGAKPEAGAPRRSRPAKQIADARAGRTWPSSPPGWAAAGTGGRPGVAEVAKEMGILTVAVVTKPFSFEGVRRIRLPRPGIAELSSAVDSVS